MLHKNLSIGKNGNLFFAGRDTTVLAKKYGTPLMLLDEENIREKCRMYKAAMEKHFGKDSMALYASKALSFKHIYKLLKQEDMAIDVVSIGEMYTAKKAGFNLKNAYFHGNNKSDEELSFAMKSNIGYFVVDNKDELVKLDSIAKANGKNQKILLRLTPGIDPHTHQSISTGKVDSKFGTPIETGQAEEIIKFALNLKNIDLQGFHCHIGSQIFDIKPFCDAADLMIKFISYIYKETGYMPPKLNLGGGFGVRYTENHPKINIEKNIKEISSHIKKSCKAYNIIQPTILMEPGRSIVADSGLTLYTAGSKKEIIGYKNYVSIDGGMTDNPRYALYQSPYTVMVANKVHDPANYTCTIAGKCCESGDLIQENVKLPTPERGDIIAVLVTGAYNYSMASNYNKVPRPQVVMLSKRGEKTVIKRESLKDLIRLEI